MDRKYKQRGYQQDDEREQRPRATPPPRGDIRAPKMPAQRSISFSSKRLSRVLSNRASPTLNNLEESDPPSI